MELRQAIVERRTIHSFKQQQVEWSLVEQLLQDAAWAPNHRLAEPWNIVAVTGDVRAAYAEKVITALEAIGFAQKFSPEKFEERKVHLREFAQNVPTHLVIHLQRDENEHTFLEDYAAVATFIQNFQLLAWENGLGMVWSSGRYIQDNGFKRDLNIPEDHVIAGILHVGYPEKVPAARPRTPIAEKITFLQTEEVNV